jgi:ATP-binding protein involved in chromosome partitioning
LIPHRNIFNLFSGTGDVHISLNQILKISGSIIVSTPQDIALLDVGKGINMYEKMGVPILGVVQNMSGFICEKCSSFHHIFGNPNSMKSFCDKRNVKILGEIPLSKTICETSELGTPEVLNKSIREIYDSIADQILIQK